MFDGASFPKSLDEDVFDSWLERGRESKMRYDYLLIIWNELESAYHPLYLESREEVEKYAKSKTSHDRELLVAAYDLYSEGRII